MQCSKKCALKTGRRKRAGKAKDEETPRRRKKKKQVCDPHRVKTDDGNQNLVIRVEVELRDKGGEFVVVGGCVCVLGGVEEKEPAQQYGSIALGK